MALTQEARSVANFLAVLADAVDQRNMKHMLKMPEQEFVYAMQSKAFPSSMKIGRSKDTKTRLIALNVGMPEHPYKLVARFATYNAKQDEKDVHEAFKQHRIVNEHYSMSLDSVLHYFKEKNAMHLKNRNGVRSRVHLTRAFVTWKKTVAKVPEGTRISHIDTPNERMSEEENHKRKIDVILESFQEFDSKKQCIDEDNRAWTAADSCDMNVLKTCNRMQMDLITKAIPVMDKLTPGWMEKDPDMVEDMKWTIKGLVRPRLPTPKKPYEPLYLQHSQSINMLDFQSKECALATITNAIDVMEKIGTSSNSDWKGLYPDMVEEMKSELMYGVMGLSYYGPM